jgi:hypothetical protein
MPKYLLYLFAVLPLLLAALVLGREPGPRAGEVRSAAKARSTIHAHSHVARGVLYASMHDRSAIDDDDVYDGDDEIETAMLAPKQHSPSDVSSDATCDGGAASADSPPLPTTVASLRLTGRGIRPSGEHRSAADRPPRI